MTTVGEAKRRIAALLANASALSGIDVQRHDPTTSNDVHPEMIFLGFVEGEGDWGALGKLTRIEQYTIDLHIRIWRDDSSSKDDAEDRLWDIYDATETALRSDPALGGLLQGNMQLKNFRQGTERTLEPKGYRSGADCQIAVKAQLRLP